VQRVLAERATKKAADEAAREEVVRRRALAASADRAAFLAHPALRDATGANACWEQGELERLCTASKCPSVALHLANQKRCAVACPECAARWYCTTDCRVADAPLHADECARWRATKVGGVGWRKTTASEEGVDPFALLHCLARRPHGADRYLRWLTNNGPPLGAHTDGERRHLAPFRVAAYRLVLRAVATHCPVGVGDLLEWATAACPLPDSHARARTMPSFGTPVTILRPLVAELLARVDESVDDRHAGAARGDAVVVHSAADFALLLELLHDSAAIAHRWRCVCLHATLVCGGWPPPLVAIVADYDRLGFGSGTVFAHHLHLSRCGGGGGGGGAQPPAL
jgi:hypothetical protein